MVHLYFSPCSSNQTVGWLVETNKQSIGLLFGPWTYNPNIVSPRLEIRVTCSC